MLVESLGEVVAPLRPEDAVPRGVMVAPLATQELLPLFHDLVLCEDVLVLLEQFSIQFLVSRVVLYRSVDAADILYSVDLWHEVKHGLLQASS